MTPDPMLRQRCEVFLDERHMSIPITEEPECVDVLVKFVTTERAAVWREVVTLANAKASKATASFAGEAYNSGYRGGLCGFARECEARAKEEST